MSMSEKCILHPDRNAMEVLVMQVGGEKYRITLCDECFFERHKYAAIRKEIRSAIKRKSEAIRLIILGQMKLPLRESGREI